ncbi:LOW QUALITY PROTEIN: hypothetical protein PHMEG_00015448 [Phytophthora megakarya]|uniref:Uncharacterized protein n=1 Tax=Phytophthora megakarya TaxID=4795 RepID=A0A225W193_9STRA|nr:LOW QUALITY PROTEIN: hypothetical protein PHMEG_00015448 [Phytophthora megakarya]
MLLFPPFVFLHEICKAPGQPTSCGDVSSSCTPILPAFTDALYCGPTTPVHHHLCPNALHCFSTILRSGALEVRVFGSLPQPDVHVFMDASSKGLCVLDPGSERYLTLTFDVDEVANQTFDSNIREQVAVALACLIFG